MDTSQWERELRAYLDEMFIKEIIGRRISDILVWVNYESYGLDEADTFIVLDNGWKIGLPWSIDADATVWLREIDKEAKSIFEGKKNDTLFSMQGKRIVDLLSFEEGEEIEAEKAIIELEEERFFTEITIAPNGTGLAGLWVFQSRDDLEKRYGKKYKRWSELK